MTGPSSRELVSLNETALRTGLIGDISGVFGGNAFLSASDIKSGETVVQALKAALSSQLTRVIDLFHEWDENSDGKVSKREFRRGLAMLLDRSPSEEDSNNLFDEWDKDGSGTIEYRELNRLLRGLGPRAPRTPLWAPKAAQQPATRPSTGGASSSCSAGAAATAAAGARAVSGGIILDTGRESRPSTPATKLSYARSEAVLLGQMVHRKPSTVAQSQKRVKALNRISSSMVKAADRELERLEVLHRQRAQAEARTRHQRSEAAKSRQAEAIGEIMSPLRSRSAAAPRPPSQGSVMSVASVDDLHECLSMSSITGYAPAFGKGGLVDDDEAAIATATAVLPWAACNYANSRPGTASSLSASHRGFGGSASECFGAAASNRSLISSASTPAVVSVKPPASMLQSSASISGVRGYSKKEMAHADMVGFTPSPRRGQAIWPEDVISPMMRPASVQYWSGAGALRAPTLVRQVSARPSSFVSSLRSPSGVALTHVPLLPRPPVAEAGRSGLFNPKPDPTKLREAAILHARYQRPGARGAGSAVGQMPQRKQLTPDEVAEERRKLVSAWLEKRLEDV